MKNTKLKLRLFEEGITQSELAQKTKIPSSYISLSINGRFLLGQEQKRKIASFFGCSVEDVF